MFLRKSWNILLLGVFLSCLTVLACHRRHSEEKSIPKQNHNEKWDYQGADSEYRLLQAELGLAKSESLYLVLDLRRQGVQLKLKGTVVWSYPMTVRETDFQKLQEFAQRFEGEENRLIRPISEKYLFAAQNKTPDSVLAIISDAVKAKPELMQRDVPGRFQLMWGYGLILEIHTDITGLPKSKLKNTIVEFRQALRRPFGETQLVLQMSPEQALTLYRVARPGLPTLLCPPR
ncbi:MAG: hypothetical protein WCE90_04735 [Candidatus Zixiibacteriota bacterium]